MPLINRIRVNNVRYNFGTQMYDDFMLRPFGRNMLYDLANGGGKSVLMLLMLQTIIPNCTLDEKQPVEKLFRTGDGSQTIHSLIEWKLDPAQITDGMRYMTAGFCARKAPQEGREGGEAKEAASIEYFNYCIFYRDYNENDIRNLPLSKDGEKITYNGLRRYLKDLEKDSVRVRIFDRKGEYQRFLGGYGIYESTWELIRGINKTEGHVRTYFETNYRTTRKVVEDLLIEEIIQKSFLLRTDGAAVEDSMANTLLDMKDQLAELARRREEMGQYDRQAKLLKTFADQAGGLKELYAKKEQQEKELTRTYEGATWYYESRKRDCEERQRGIESLTAQIEDIKKRIACARLCGDRNRAAQMVLEIEMLAGGLETVKNLQARELMSLQMKESMNDYLEYQEEKKKRDEVAETIRAMQDKSTDLTEELKRLTWHMKRRMDQKKTRMLGECVRYREEEGRQKERQARYEAEILNAQRKEAVAESRIADWKEECRTRRNRMADQMGEAGILLAEEAENTAGLRAKETEALKEEQEALQKDLKAAKETAESLRVKLAELYGRSEEQKKEQEALEAFEEAYREKRGQVLKYLRIYKKPTLEEALERIQEKEEEAVREEAVLTARKEEKERQKEALENRKWVPEDGVQEQLVDYARERYREEIVTGADYLEALDETKREKLLLRYPFLPFAVIAGSAYEKLGSDRELLNTDWLKGCIPVIRRELLEKGENLLLQDRILLLTEDRAWMFCGETLEKEGQRLEREIAKLTQSLALLAERRKTYRADAEALREFLLFWERDCGEKADRRQACEEAYRQLQIQIEEAKEQERQASEAEAQQKQKEQDIQSLLDEKERSLAALRALAEEYREYRKADLLLSGAQADYRAAGAAFEKAKEGAAECRERLRELALAVRTREESAAAMDRDWEEKYSVYYEEGDYGELSCSDEELAARLNGRRMAALSKNAELEDKNRLVNSYILAMNRCLRSITARGISVADLTERHEKGELYQTGEEELSEARKRQNNLTKEIASRQKALELLKADWNRLDGRNTQAAEEIERTYGSYEEMKLDTEDAKNYLAAAQETLDKRQSELTAATGALEAAREEIRTYEDVRRDIERMFRGTGIEPSAKEVRIEEGVDLRSHFREVEEQYERLLKRLSKEQEKFFRNKETLIRDLEEAKAHPLAEEIRTAVKLPADTEDVDQIQTGLEQIVECLALEMARIEDSIRELQSMKENFESQCLQRCMNIRTELERLPKLSGIMLDGELIPIIRLSVPYVKEEFFRERMSAYIDEIVRGADKMENNRDRLKYIRAALAWKKLFSVIVTDMNAIRLTLYKRERIKEQSRHLRYEEAVGSTGQSQGIYIQFLIAIIHYIASINSAQADPGELTKVIFIDNPFGAAKDIYIWEPIFALLRTNRVQLIVPARGTTPAITGRFDVNYVLGQKLADGKQLTVVTEYVSRVDTGDVEYIPLRYEQASLDII